MIAVFTTARTTAFIPALSPPEVSTASFIFFPAVALAIAEDPESSSYKTSVLD